MFIEVLWKKTLWIFLSERECKQTLSVVQAARILGGACNSESCVVAEMIIVDKINRNQCNNPMQSEYEERATCSEKDSQDSSHLEGRVQALQTGSGRNV